MAQTLPFSSHYMLLVDHNRAEVACEWYNRVFGVEVLHQTTTIMDIPQSIVYASIIYIRIVGTSCIIQIQEAFRPRQLGNLSRGIMCLYVDNPDVVCFRAFGHGAMSGGSQINGPRIMEKFTDIFGYSWAVGTRNFLTPELLRLNFNLHYILTVPHNRIHTSINWYINVFGAVLIGEQTSVRGFSDIRQPITRAFLRLGLPEHSLIIEVVVTHRIPNRIGFDQRESQEMVIIFVEDVVRFTQRIMEIHHEPNSVILTELNHQNRLMGRIRDPNGYLWMILSSNDIPEIVLG